MIIPDANLLIYAYDSTSRYHLKSKQWWEETLSGETLVGIPLIVVMAFTRLMTHPTIATQPLTISQVRKRIQAWFEFPQIRLLSSSPHTLEIFFDLLEPTELGGNLTTDAMIAALSIEYSGIVYTNDHDFSRFRGIRCKNPLLERKK